MRPGDQGHYREPGLSRAALPAPPRARARAERACRPPPDCVFRRARPGGIRHTRQERTLTGQVSSCLVSSRTFQIVASLIAVSIWYLLFTSLLTIAQYYVEWVGLSSLLSCVVGCCQAMENRSEVAAAALRNCRGDHLGTRGVRDAAQLSGNALDPHGIRRWHLTGGQGVAGSNPVVPTSVFASRRPFPRVAEAALTVSRLGAMGSPLGALVLPTRRRVNPVRFVRHPIRSTCRAVSPRCALSSAAGRQGHPAGMDALAIERHKTPLTAPDPLSEWEPGFLRPMRQQRSGHAGDAGRAFSQASSGSVKRAV